MSCLILFFGGQARIIDSIAKRGLFQRFVSQETERGEFAKLLLYFSPTVEGREMD